MRPVSCLFCGQPVSVELAVCRHCGINHDLDVVKSAKSGAQQYRVIMSHRFSDSKHFANLMRLSCHNIGMEPVYGPATIRMVAQRTEYEGGVMGASRFLLETLKDVGIGPDTDLQSMNVTLLPGGNLLTMVECRGLLGDEMAGLGGVGR